MRERRYRGGREDRRYIHRAYDGHKCGVNHRVSIINHHHVPAPAHLLNEVVCVAAALAPAVVLPLTCLSWRDPLGRRFFTS